MGFSWPHTGPSGWYRGPSQILSAPTVWLSVNDVLAYIPHNAIAIIDPEVRLDFPFVPCIQREPSSAFSTTKALFTVGMRYLPEPIQSICLVGIELERTLDACAYPEPF